jgi:hypothetical protein
MDSFRRLIAMALVGLTLLVVASITSFDLRQDADSDHVDVRISETTPGEKQSSSAVVTDSAVSPTVTPAAISNSVPTSLAPSSLTPISLDREAASRDELRLSATGFTALQKFHRGRLDGPSPTDGDRFFRPSSRCPQRRFLYVNTHTYGRHHNQLQEFVNVILAAQRLNRTAVIGYFRANHQWTDPSVLYDLALIRRAYCAIDADVFRRQVWPRVQRGENGNGAPAIKMGASPPSAYAVCMGQGLKGTPLRSSVRGCRLWPGVPAHYSTRAGLNITRDNYFPLLASHEHVAGANFVCVSGQIAFFLKPPLVELVGVFGLLRPAKVIRDEVVATLSRMQFRATDAAYQALIAATSVGTDAAPSDQASTVASSSTVPYFALHLRQREKECMKEREEALADNPALRGSLTASQLEATAIQCGLTVPYVNQLLERHVGASGIFLASDHENQVLEKALVDRGARMYTAGAFTTATSGATALHGLAVDFWLMVAGEYFSGNQISSITQNACYVRLGLGQGCQGFIEAYALHWALPL